MFFFALLASTLGALLVVYRWVCYAARTIGVDDTSTFLVGSKVDIVCKLL